jgi:hypothetical protein
LQWPRAFAVGVLLKKHAGEVPDAKTNRNGVVPFVASLRDRPAIFLLTPMKCNGMPLYKTEQGKNKVVGSDTVVDLVLFQPTDCNFWLIGALRRALDCKRIGYFRSQDHCFDPDPEANCTGSWYEIADDHDEVEAQYGQPATGSYSPQIKWEGSPKMILRNYEAAVWPSLTISGGSYAQFRGTYVLIDSHGCNGAKNASF